MRSYLVPGKKTRRNTCCFFLFTSLFLQTGYLLADQLLPGGDFELPHVAKRTEKKAGGNPQLDALRGDWSLFDLKPNSEGGSIRGGLTNEVSHGGKQSLWIEFDQLTAINAATLSSRMISILPEKEYRAALWGRLDPKKPFPRWGRVSFLRLQVDFYEADQATQVPDSVLRVQSVPGGEDEPFFSADLWHQLFVDFKTPPGAAFLRVTWTLQPAPSVGSASGTLFVDDATLTGPAGPEPKTEETEPDASPAPKPSASPERKPSPAP